MFRIFTLLADAVVYDLFSMEKGSRAAESLHFFIEDVTKIYALVVVMIYLIAVLRAGLNTERVRAYLQGKSRSAGYVIAVLFGAVTPFCSCSSIPLFLGFTSAGIPLGITMAFLITSPMINEVAIALLGGLLGINFTLVYIITGLSAGILGGLIIDALKADRYLTDLGLQAKGMSEEEQKGANTDANTDDAEAAGSKKTRHLSLKERHLFAKDEVSTIFGRIWKWVLIGVGAGAMLHGFVPEEFITDTLGDGQWWSVPAAVLLGIPLYSNATGIIPVAESLLLKGLPVGTTLALMMSTVAASFPEFVLLKQVMKSRLLVFFFFLLLVMFTSAGWIFNALF
ncbi:MAG: permease [Spirochaetia bacterium]|nr:permease [Spirochaetia bacterium]MCF7952577.1 permease [Spirochaetales bacterium]